MPIRRRTHSQLDAQQPRCHDAQDGEGQERELEPNKTLLTKMPASIPKRVLQQIRGQDGRNEPRTELPQGGTRDTTPLALEAQ